MDPRIRKHRPTELPNVQCKSGILKCRLHLARPAKAVHERQAVMHTRHVQCDKLAARKESNVSFFVIALAARFSHILSGKLASKAGHRVPEAR